MISLVKNLMTCLEFTVPHNQNNFIILLVFSYNPMVGYSYNLSEDQLFIPSWIEGFHLSNDPSIWNIGPG
jgi:hypothetical protein